MSAPEHRTPPPEPEGVHTRTLLVVGIAALALFTLAVVAQWLLLRVWGQPFVVPEALGQREIGMVDQVPFEENTQAASLRERQRQRLTTYGWVDREAGLIHLPVEEAARQLLAEEEGAR